MKTVNVTQVPAGAQLIDVREADEYAEGHAPTAKLIALSEFTSRVGELDPDRDIYIICRSGGRSGQACEYLSQAHGLDAINVAGGTLAWIEAGLPLEK
ncbi:rhodanese-like domain-containing protein [Corynebacterium comes]|uniref:Adenylyltransferase/sulfurtransferase MoeZ n=1 Tax=Corynebacterium comes TaxID=2675218 RepID=A0A6B8W3R9_9CORY|nr:rhodanese-like domain-containing protein [Corynebacterium comes]QGU05566.1 putative adenylyltransferase/sulfurtransferase MoeZ [Corynebacterium comes]